VNTKELTIEDVIDMSQRERDRVVAEWMGETMPASDSCKDDVAFNMYHVQWNHAGRALEALPRLFLKSPSSWFAEELPGKFQVPENPLSRQSIVLAACICAVRGVEPEDTSE